MCSISGLVLGSQSDHFLCQYVGLTLSNKCILPRLAHPLHRPLGNPQIDFQKEHLVDTDLFHILQLGRHLAGVQIAVIEIPINARLRGVGWVFEALLERLLASKRANEREREKQCRFFRDLIAYGQGLGRLDGSGLVGSKAPFSTRASFSSFKR